MKKFVVVILILVMACMFNVAYAQEESGETEQEEYIYEEILEEISGKLDVLEEIEEEINILVGEEGILNILVGEEGILDEIKIKLDGLSEGIEFLSSIEDIEQIVEIKEWIKNINAMLFWIVVVVIPLVVFVVLGWILLRSFF